MNRFLVPTLSLALSGAAFGQADECVNATDLGMGPSSMTFDTNMAVDTGLAATTSAENACNSSGDVWFRYTASVTGTGTFSTCNGGTFDTEIGVYEGADCSTFTNLGCNDDAGGCANFTSQISVPITAGTVYYVNVGHFSTVLGNFGAGTLTISEDGGGTVPSNDDCSTPDVALVGATMFDTSGISTSGFDGGGSCGFSASSVNQDIFYTFTPADGGIYTIDLMGSTFDTKLSVHDGSDCMATCLAHNDDFSGLQSLVEVSIDAGQTVLVQVGGFGSGTGAGVLNINLTGSFCDTPDAFEGNTGCADAAPVMDGTITGLNVTETDQDYYSLSLADGATLDASILFFNANADIDLYLWDPTVGCDTNVAGTGGPWLVRGFSGSDDEVISYTNMTGATQTLILEVDVFSVGGCNQYDLVVSGSGDGVGVPFCLAVANSTGASASMTGSGSASLMANDLVLTVSDLPADVFGFVIASESRGFAPMAAGGMGNICLDGDIGRGVGGQIYSSGAGGAFSADVDWTTLPQPMGTVAATIGDTWYFQAWTRDTVGGMNTSNLSNALSVLVQ